MNSANNRSLSKLKIFLLSGLIVVGNVIYLLLISCYLLIWLSIIFKVYLKKSSVQIYIPFIVLLTVGIYLNVFFYKKFYKKYTGDAAVFLFLLNIFITITPYLVYFLTGLLLYP